ncbi:putative reverse transcriptase domain-containing protein [Tanacetum coccineum]
MPPRMRTRSAGRHAAESLGGGTVERVGRGGRGRIPRKDNDERVEDLNGQGNDQGLGANGGVEGVNRNVEGANRGERGECVSKWQLGSCSNDQKVKYNAGSFVGKALTWWNSQIRTLSQEVAVSMSWNDFKFMKIQEFCHSHEMQKLESELWNQAMVGADHAVNTDKFYELVRLVPHLVTPESRMIEMYVYGLAPQIHGMVAATEPKTMQKAVQISGALTDEAVRNGSIKKVDKRGNVGETSKDKNGRDGNKRTRTGNVFATIVNPVGRENIGTWSKCTTCNSYHAPGGICRTCFNCNRPSHSAKDCRGVSRNVNPVNARNPTVRACYECGSTDYVRSACPRLNRAQEPEGNHPNQVATNNGGQGRGNQRNQARGRAFMLGAEEARQDPNIVTGTVTPPKITCVDHWDEYHEVHEDAKRLYGGHNENIVITQSNVSSVRMMHWSKNTSTEALSGSKARSCSKTKFMHCCKELSQNIASEPARRRFTSDILLTLWSLLLGPGAVPAGTTLSNSKAVRTYSPNFKKCSDTAQMKTSIALCTPDRDHLATLLFKFVHNGPLQEHECNESFNLERPPALS